MGEMAGAWRERRPAGDDALVISAAILHEGDLGKLVDDEDRISRPGVTVLAHQVDLLVLEADDLLGLQLDPAREEGRAMGAVLIEVVGDADAGAGRLVP